MRKVGRLLCAVLLCACYAYAATIFKEPSETTVKAGNTFSVDVNVSGVSDLYAFQFTLRFDAGRLRVQSVSEGALFKGVGVAFSPGLIENAAGTVQFISDSLSGPGPGISGDGTLATIFFGFPLGDGNIGLSDVLLFNSDLNDIPVTTAGGAHVTVLPYPEPATFALCGSGAVVIFLRRRRRRRPGGTAAE